MRNLFDDKVNITWKPQYGLTMIPIVGDKTEAKLKAKLIECPQCNYTCRASWKKCPICETKIQKI